MSKKLGVGVVIFCLIAVIIHVLFIVFIFSIRKIDCVDRIDPLMEFELFLIWSIVYFPLLLLCACYTLVFRMLRSFCCSCWSCCGQNEHGKKATQCKICFEGVFGNPALFVICFILWGIYEWTLFGAHCTFEIQYGFLGDLVVVSLSLILLCIYYFIRVKRRFHEKRNQNIAKKYQDQQRADAHIGGYKEEGKGVAPRVQAQIANNQPYNIQVQAPPGRGQRARSQLEAEGSGQPLPHRPDRRYSAQPQLQGNRNGALGPSYAASAQGMAPYQPEQRRHSYQPGPAAPPAYAASAQGIGPYKPQEPRRHSFQPNANPLIANNKNNFNRNNIHSKKESASIEISVDLEDDEDDLIGSGHRTRGPSISFPNQYKGHARRVSSGILNILKKIDAEPECSICMDDLAKGDEMGQLECGHTFHKDCIVEWLGNEPSCPMCRVEMTKQ
eukprot:1034469_1